MPPASFSRRNILLWKLHFPTDQQLRDYYLALSDCPIFLLAVCNVFPNSGDAIVDPLGSVTSKGECCGE